MTTATIVYSEVVLTKAYGQPAKIDRGEHIANTVLVNIAELPGIDPPPAAILALVATARARQTDVRNHVGGSGTALKNALRDLANALKTVIAFMQKLCNASPKEAATIAARAAMTLKRQPGARAAQDAVKCGKLPGTADGRIRAPGRKYAVEWAGSVNGGETWPISATSDRAKVAFTGLALNTKHMFKHRVTMKGVTSDWSQNFTILIR